MFKVSRDYYFEASHRIEGHPKCGRLHGHSYRVNVSVKAVRDADMPNGMVIDFGDLDRIVKPLIDAMDHRYLVSNANLRATDERRMYATVAIKVGDAFLLNVDHSTAEMIAFKIRSDACLALRKAGFTWVTAKLMTVSVQETLKNVASYGE